MIEMQTVSSHGAEIPAIGLGTWNIRGEWGARVAAEALAVGYRHIDTAASYGNEEAIGDGVRASGVPREEIFIVTKIPRESLADGASQRSIEGSLRRLGFDYVDLALIHWPNMRMSIADQIAPLNDVKRRGLARHIGLSNFNSSLVEEAVAASKEPLVANQCEYHPYLNQDRVLAACRRHGIAFTSYCPLGRDIAFEETAIAGTARTKGRTPAQVVLRWQLQQRGVVPIPKTSNPQRLRENLDVFDFSLSDAEMEAISALTLTHHERICGASPPHRWDD
jgi:diketogulonate reductase-like aldo/keto reductase